MIKFSDKQMLTVHSKCCKIWETNTSSWLDMIPIFKFNPEIDEDLIYGFKIEEKLILLENFRLFGEDIYYNLHVFNINIKD